MTVWRKQWGMGFSVAWATVAGLGFAAPAAVFGQTVGPNLITNGTLEAGESDTAPPGFDAIGGARFGYLGDMRTEISSRGYALLSSQASGEVATTVMGLNGQKGRWYRFTFRGLPQSQFAVSENDLYMKVAFFGKNGTVSYDAKDKKFYDQILTARRDLGVNGMGRRNGAAAWHNYQLDFYLPFPQVDSVRLSVGFGHGAAKTEREAAFFVDDLCLVALPDPAPASSFGTVGNATPRPAIVPKGELLPLGGRWFYAARPGEKAAPKTFTTDNADRLIYRDAVYSAPFAGNTSAWLRVGNRDVDGKLVQKDRLVRENVTVTFEGAVLKVTTRNIPNHPTGRYPEQGFGNPSYIQEQVETYYLPLNPQERKGHTVTNTTNSNGALHMGPIGVAVNGVVFFNPFDMGNVDATNMMDKCCGHPNPDNQYHYHKYPICVNSPWADEGKAHSPLLGWAFDGFPLYGPYESADIMAKDVTGERALNAFNMHYDAERGWHYHVTPGKFPYLIGGFWGTEDARNVPRRRGGPGSPGGFGNPGPFGGFPPPPGGFPGGPPPEGFPPPPPPGEFPGPPDKK